MFPFSNLFFSLIHHVSYYIIQNIHTTTKAFIEITLIKNTAKNKKIIYTCLCRLSHIRKKIHSKLIRKKCEHNEKIL